MNSAPRSISLLTATSLVVANMVGTGVFTSLGFQVGGLPSGFAILSLWLLGGICAFCGALCYGELAAALPRSGGEYHFLSRSIHPAVGFVAGWISATVGFAAPVALAAMAFGTYLSTVIPGVSPLGPSLLVVGLVTAVHLRGLRWSSIFQNVATSVKLLLIIFLIAFGFWRHPESVNFLPKRAEIPLLWSSPFAVSLVYVMYAYTGWNASIYIASELRNPGRDLPRSVAYGTALVVLLYLGLNAVFLLAAPMAELAGKLEVGQVAAAGIFGSVGGQIMAGLICIGLISSISAMTWIGPRVTMAMGEDCRLLSWWARKNAQGIPSIALLSQSAVVLILLLSASFETVLTYLQLSLSISSFLTVIGMMVLRWREPNLPRPYRTWAYPLTPLIFLSVNGWMIYQVLSTQPRESLAGLGTMLLGLIIYALAPTQPSAEAR